MVTLKKNEYIKIARNVGVFNPRAIKILKNVLDNYEHSPGKDYSLIEERRGYTLVGFLFFGRTPLTRFSWDVYWLIVDKGSQGKGIGKKLLERAEGIILKKEPKAVLRVETSTNKEFAHARNLYVKVGYSEAGRIPDFYDRGDDLIVYHKRIGCFHEKEPEGSGKD